MSLFKTFLNFIFGGTLLGILVASLAAPSFIEWYNSTPLATQTMCNLPEVVRNVTHSLMNYQLIGAAVGAGVGLVVAIILAVRARKAGRTPPTATQTPASPAQTPPVTPG